MNDMNECCARGWEWNLTALREREREICAEGCSVENVAGGKNVQIFIPKKMKYLHLLK